MYKTQLTIIMAVMMFQPLNAIASPRHNTTIQSPWKLVTTVKGNTSQKTKTFIVGPRWSIIYTTGTGKYDGLGRTDRHEITEAYIFPVGPHSGMVRDERGVSHSAPYGPAFTQQSSGQGNLPEYGAGKYYIEVASNQSYVVRIYTHN